MERLPTVFMFSGQGSQYFEMGRQLFDEDQVFRRNMTELDVIPRNLIGQSVVEQLYASGRGRGDLFDQILVSHPAIFMVEYSVAQSLMQRGVYPDIVMGTSLGAFAAATVAGVLVASEALRAIIEQAQAIEMCCRSGGMVAILEHVNLYNEPFLQNCSTLASINFKTHFTISTDAESLLCIENELRQRRINFQRLPVRFAFHSRWIDEAKALCMASLSTLSMLPGTCQVLCDSTPRIVRQLPIQSLWDAVRQPMRFQEAIDLLEREGPKNYVDAGPSGTLATFLKYGLDRKTGSTISSTLTPFGLDVRNLSALTDKLRKQSSV